MAQVIQTLPLGRNILPPATIGADGYCHRSLRAAIRPSVRPERHYRCLRISAISLKYGGMVRSTMEQMAIKNGHAQPIFASSTKLWNFPW